MDLIYDEHTVENVAYMLDMREPNRNALDAIAQALEGAEHGAELVADLATGVGKTYIAGGLLDYLWMAGVRNVVIVTPGSAILRKTVDNLTPGHPKYLRGLQCDPLVITLDTVGRGEVGAALDDESRMKVFVFTIQSLLRPNKEDRRRAHAPHETLGQGLYDYLQGRDDLVVVADEHHVYYSKNARKFRAALDELDPLATVGLTATPHEHTTDKIVFTYSLAEAIADGWVKIPVLVGRRDKVKDMRTRLTDALTLLDAKKAAVTAYTTRFRHKRYVEPLLFVVASNIDEANEIRDLLAGPDLLADESAVLLVTSEESDSAFAALDTLEASDSKVRAVVSVSMLNEGWDVKNIYVIAAVRSLESKLLTEQILGRGLRLPFGERTGNPMLDTVEVLSHDSFSDLLRRAEALMEGTLGERARDAEFVIDPQPGVRGTALPGTEAATHLPDTPGTPGGGQVDVLLPGPAATDPDQYTLFNTDDLDPAEASETRHTGMSIASVDARVATGQTSTQTLTTSIAPNMGLGLRLPLLLPKVITKWVRDPFSLSRVNLTNVEALGRRFADDNAPTLTRKAIDAERDDRGEARVVIRDEVSDDLTAAVLPIPFDTIETDLTSRLLRTNGIEQTVTEANAAVEVAKSFLAGAAVTEDTPWRAEHGRLATAALTEYISTLQTSSPAREVREVEHVRWPDPADRTETRPPTDRHQVTDRRAFVRGYPYSGWTRGLYGVNGFDAYGTEFLLASLFEKPRNGIRAWVRIDDTVPLRIAYLIGAVQRSYEPDFIVADDQGVFWIVEGKRDDEMTSPLVLAKRDAAREWVNTVNASPEVADKWGYVLASESVIRNASSWNAVKNGGQTYT